MQLSIWPSSTAHKKADTLTGIGFDLAKDGGDYIVAPTVHGTNSASP